MEKSGTFSERLKASRKMRGLSQEEVAQRAGIKQTSYSQLENGRSKSSRHLLQLAEALDVDPHWLLTGVELEGIDEQIYSAVRRFDVEDKRAVMEMIRAIERARSRD